jgi:hypothetical protein
MKKENCKTATPEIEIADIVHHAPTGEDWIVAKVDARHVWPAGWPPCRADREDSTLVRKGGESRRSELIARLKELPESDERKYREE